MSAREGSASSRLLALAVGERFYIDTTPEMHGPHMTRALVPRSRRPKELAGREFKAALFTAVCASNCKDVRYIICVERTQ